MENSQFQWKVRPRLLRKPNRSKKTMIVGRHLGVAEENTDMVSKDLRGKLLQAAGELDMATILSSLRPLKIWESTDKQESNLRRVCESRRLTVDKK